MVCFPVQANYFALTFGEEPLTWGFWVHLKFCRLKMCLSHWDTAALIFTWSSQIWLRSLLQFVIRSSVLIWPWSLFNDCMGPQFHRSCQQNEKVSMKNSTWWKILGTKLVFSPKLRSFIPSLGFALTGSHILHSIKKCQKIILRIFWTETRTVPNLVHFTDTQIGDETGSKRGLKNGWFYTHDSSVRVILLFDYRISVSHFACVSEWGSRHSQGYSWSAWQVF